jgi:tetratricopeptide (TPR) repeat protein
MRHRQEARFHIILEETLATLEPHNILALEYAAQMAPDAVPLVWLRELLESSPNQSSHALQHMTATQAETLSSSTSEARPSVSNESMRAKPENPFPDSDEAWAALILRLHGLRLLYRPSGKGDHQSQDDNILNQLNNPTATLSIHRLVQDHLRARSGDQAEARRKAVDEKLTAACYFIREHWHEPDHRWLFCVLESFADAWLTRAEQGEPTLVRDTAVVVSYANGALDQTAEWPRAEPLLRRLNALLDRLGPASTELATSLNNLAQLLYATNRLAEAEPLIQRALAIDEANFGKDHPNVARYVNNLAMLLQSTSRTTEAEPLLRRALAINEASLGKDHPDVARNLNNLAMLLYSVKRLAEAETLLRRAQVISEASLGKDHPDVALGLSNLSELLRATRRLSEAEPLQRRALSIFESCLGANHHKVASSLSNLAVLLQDSNRHAEAEPLIRRALAIDETCFGSYHPNVALRLSNLAMLLNATNRNAEATTLMRRAVVILMLFEKTTGHQHPDLKLFQIGLIQIMWGKRIRVGIFVVGSILAIVVTTWLFRWVHH